MLHDIGRRFGVAQLAHVYNGYHYLLELGYQEAAKIALTHSFVHGKIENYLGKFDISKEKQKELVLLLQKTQFDDYDYLIQLCDAIAGADGIVSLEERMEDVKSRYGYYPQEMWDKTVELKRYFENKMQKNLYDISQPIGIAAYELTKVLREEFKSSLPKVEEIENELSE